MHIAVIGGEPLASLLSFAVVEINQHSDVLGLLLCEVDEVLGKKSQITIEDLNKLKYTEQVQLLSFFFFVSITQSKHR